MVQELTTKPNMFGRLGMGLARGLSETVPKEVERQRLSSGLQQFEQDSGNLSPMQQLARLSAIPGITPQMIQSFGELGKQQGMRNSLRGGSGQGSELMPGAPGKEGMQDPRVMAAMQQMGMGGQENQGQMPQQQRSIPSGFNDRTEQAKAQHGATENPLGEKYLPAEPLNQDQRNALELRLSDKFPDASYEEVRRMADAEEVRRQENPKAWQEKNDYITKRENDAEKILENQLETALQKEGKDLYRDISGDTLLDLKKAMNNDLATDPSITPKQAAEKWRLKARDFVESKNKLKVAANRDLIDALSPNDKKETLKDLMTAQNRFADLGKQKEFAKLLSTKNRPPEYSIDEDGNRVMTDTGATGFNLSEGKAALIAYPRSEKLKGLLYAFNVDNVPINELPSYSAKLASDFLKNKTGNDSVLAFAQSAKDKSGFFDEAAFFDYLRENENKLNPDQQLELQSGVKALKPTWGNLSLFPIFGRSVVHD